MVRAAAAGGSGLEGGQEGGGQVKPQCFQLVATLCPALGDGGFKEKACSARLSAWTLSSHPSCTACRVLSSGFQFAYQH